MIRATRRHFSLYNEPWQPLEGAVYRSRILSTIDRFWDYWPEITGARYFHALAYISEPHVTVFHPIRSKNQQEVCYKFYYITHTKILVTWLVELTSLDIHYLLPSTSAINQKVLFAHGAYAHAWLTFSCAIMSVIGQYVRGARSLVESRNGPLVLAGWMI